MDMPRIMPGSRHYMLALLALLGLSNISMAQSTNAQSTMAQSTTAQSTTAQSTTAQSTTENSATTAGIVVSGLGGNADYAQAFAEQGRTMADALATLAADRQRFVWLDGSTAGRKNILDAIGRQAKMAGDTFVLILLGHGSVDARGWHFNITGPDLSTDDLLGALALVQAPQQLLVVATSASGALLDVMSQPGRTVVTATKSGGEINAVRFPEYLAEAMASSVADVDRNEILTIAEAWRYANQKTREYYREHKLLASEHARLTGDNAARLAVARLGALRDSLDDPAVAALLEKRLILEGKFHALRLRKSSLPSDDYYSRLERLLLSIARLQRSIDEATGWSDGDV